MQDRDNDGPQASQTTSRLNKVASTVKEKRLNLQKDARIETCIYLYDNLAYSRQQFLRAIGHNLGAHTAAFQLTSDDNSNNDDDVDYTPSATVAATVTAAAATALLHGVVIDMCEVCHIEPRSGVALVPCRSSRFCSGCAKVVATCPMAIERVLLRVFV